MSQLIIGLGNKCIDVQGASNINGTPIILWEQHGGNNQRWVLTSDGFIESVMDRTKCLDVAGANPANGTPIILWEKHGGANQKWYLDDEGFLVSLLDRNKCIDVEGGVNSNGTRLILWSKHGGINQKWYFRDSLATSRWTINSAKAQVLAVHAALLHTGEIAYFSGDEHDKGQLERNQIDHSRLYKCATGAVTRISSPNFDVFCCGQVMMPTGDILVSGGTIKWGSHPGGIHGAEGHFRGVRNTARYNTLGGSWTPVGHLMPEPNKSTGGGRWYPTLITLPNGEILIMGGHPADDDARHNNTSIEGFRGSVWYFLSKFGTDVTNYPRLHILPDGTVFCSSPVDGRTKKYRLTPGNIEFANWVDICAYHGDGEYSGISGTSVLLPLLPSQGYKPRVLLFGSNNAKIIDLSLPSPSWQNTSPRTLSGSPIRRNCNGIILPTGEVVITGGVRPTGGNNLDSGGINEVEIFNLLTNSWSVGARASVVRNYHSVALLMPDGRVWTAGSNRDCQQSFEGGGDTRELRIEHYEPWYYGLTRPVIGRAPTGGINYSSSFEITTSQARDIKQICLIKTGSCTHAFNSDQRYIGLTFSVKNENTLVINTPPNANIAPPGFYMLFILDKGGVPSHGHFMQLPAGSYTPTLIPGWFGAEDQGGDIALFDISGNGTQDVVVFHIDNPNGENHGYYRIGWDMDAGSSYGGPNIRGWSPVMPIPDWFGSEDQGGGIAIGDISKNGRPDLVVYHLDNPGGENHGYYRIGWNLNTSGQVTAGWSPIIPIPGWFGAENHGGGIALADINGNGQLDLIVFHIDNPIGENHGYYRIGWNLNTSGQVTGGWSPIIPIPGWFGAENQGGGIALSDTNGNGRLDMIVFHMDNPSGENHGYYRIGRDLDTNGNVTNGWTAPIIVPGWFGAENQGAGIASADLNGNGRPDLVMYHIDNPGGENSGYLRVLRDI